MVCKQPYSAFKSNTSAFSGRERLAKSVVSFRRRTFRERKWQWFTFLYSRLVHFLPDLATALRGKAAYPSHAPKEGTVFHPRLQKDGALKPQSLYSLLFWRSICCRCLTRPRN